MTYPRSNAQYRDTYHVEQVGDVWAVCVENGSVRACFANRDDAEADVARLNEIETHQAVERRCSDTRY